MALTKARLLKHDLPVHGILRFFFFFLSPFATPPACYRNLSGPSGPKCPGSVPRGVRDTFLTLRGHSLDTFWTLRAPGPEGPQRHPKGHFRDTSGPKGPRDSCSRPGALQFSVPKSGNFGGIILKPQPPQTRQKYEQK